MDRASASLPAPWSSETAGADVSISSCFSNASVARVSHCTSTGTASAISVMNQSRSAGTCSGRAASTKGINHRSHRLTGTDPASAGERLAACTCNNAASLRQRRSDTGICRAVHKVRT